MAHLLNIPENVIIQHLFPLLEHNDLLRLRRVSKQAKAYADTYLWTPKPGHQGKWLLAIDSTSESKTLQAFLQSGLPPPPSRLRIIHDSEKDSPGHLCPRCSSFFEDDHLQEFMQRYSKYIIHLDIHELQIPFTSLKEIQFYESLVNLAKLSSTTIKTVGGATQFEEKTRNAHGSFLIRPTLKKLKTLSLGRTDCLDTMWNFINGVSDYLEEICHPFVLENVPESDDEDDDDDSPLHTNLVPVRELIERRRRRNQNSLLYNWLFLMDSGMVQASEMVRLFASCRDNGVMIKNLDSDFLGFLFHDENGRMIGENYRGNLFVANIIHSLMCLHDNAFLMEMPALEQIGLNTSSSGFRIWEGHDSPEWPSLRKLDVWVNSLKIDLLHFLCGSPNLKRPKLEELSFNYCSQNVRINRLPLPCPRNLGICCGNLKKLSLSYCPGDNNFFLALWEGLPLLEKVKLVHCSKLTIKGFVGNGGRGNTPVFLKLEKLKYLRLHGIDGMPGIGDAAFKKVFRHLKLTSLNSGSDKVIKSITLAGIKQLLTGPFAKTIQNLDLDQLLLAGVLGEDMDEVVSLFRCSKML